MNGSSEVRSDHAGNPSKTDKPLPLQQPVQEIAGAPKQANAERLISGIDLLDYGAGGLLPHKVYVVKGGAGVGKTILGLQYLTRGLELHEPGILITDQKPANIIAQAHAIGFNIEAAVKRGQLSILNPSQRYFDLVESPADVLAIVEELGDYIKNSGAHRLVIDPVYTLINTSYSAHFALSITQSLINALEDLPVTTLLVAGDENDAELNPIIRQLEHNAFGVIDLAHDPLTNGRLMRLAKLRYADHSNLTANYRILNGRGLMNYQSDGTQVADVTRPWEGTATRSVLLIGAPPDIVVRVTEALGSDYTVRAEADLSEGVKRAKREKPGLVLVTPSRNLGAISAILDLARDSTSSLAFLSPAANRHADKVLYLRAGADDFITQPFTPAELRARVDALIRRSGRRLTFRDSRIGQLTAEEIASLMNQSESTPSSRKGPIIEASGSDVKFHPEFDERLRRNVDTVAKFDQPFAVYWIKADEENADLNKSLAQLCRQEDIVCHNRDGEFVCILTGTDQSGVQGFESRLSARLGDRLQPERVRHGYKLYPEGTAGASV
ncbi:MAG TPA: ATPase domain-containing protein [Thermoanaerobaculia bacterium]|nr:ATPase domain-containing protein [Thermoanaerobaculia bacterium]